MGFREDFAWGTATSSYMNAIRNQSILLRMEFPVMM